MAAPKPKSAKAKKKHQPLSTKKGLESESLLKLINCFDVGKWKSKRLKGSGKQGAHRAQCILLNENLTHEEDGLLAYQAMWAIQMGAVLDRKTISHLCVTEMNDALKCLNVEHMRLQFQSQNSKNTPIQRKLVDNKWRYQVQHPGFEGALFYNEDGEITAEIDGISEDAPFTNCGGVTRFNGFTHIKKTPFLGLQLKRATTPNE